MKRRTTSDFARHFIAVGSLLFLICSTASAVTPARGLVRSALSGTWQLNTQLSRNGQSDLPGQLESGDRLIQVRAAEDWTRAESDARTTELLEATQSLQIIFHGRQLTINATGATDVLFTRTMFVGENATATTGFFRAQLVDDEVVVESTVSRMVVKEKYRVDRTTGRLFATFIVQNPKWPRALTIERVYDRLLLPKRRN